MTDFLLQTKATIHEVSNVGVNNVNVVCIGLVQSYDYICICKEWLGRCKVTNLKPVKIFDDFAYDLRQLCDQL